MSTDKFVGEDVKQKASYTREEFSEWLVFLDGVSRNMSAKRGVRTRWICEQLDKDPEFDAKPHLELNSDLTFAIYDIVKLRNYNIIRFPDRRYSQMSGPGIHLVARREDGWRLTPKP